jgi:hypothetical protein
MVEGGASVGDELPAGCECPGDEDGEEDSEVDRDDDGDEESDDDDVRVVEGNPAPAPAPGAAPRTPALTPPEPSLVHPASAVRAITQESPRRNR